MSEAFRHLLVWFEWGVTIYLFAVSAIYFVLKNKINRAATQPEQRGSKNIDSHIGEYLSDSGNGRVFTFTSIGATLSTRRKVV